MAAQKRPDDENGRDGVRGRRLVLLALALILLILLCVLLIVTLRCRIFPCGPTAEAGGPYTADEAQPLTLDGSGSTGNIMDYTWDFGNGTTGNGETTTVTYDDGPAAYAVTLTVTDNRGQTASDSAQVTVNNLPPTAEAGGPYVCQPGETIQLSGVCDDPSPVDRTTLSCTWADFSGAALSQPGYVCPTTPGTVTVTLTATDKDGASAQDTATIAVTTLKADANGPYTGTVGSAVTLDGSQSEGSITSYDWEFGDGQIGSGEMVTHTYSQTGVYSVTLTVRDDGNQDTDTTTATITTGGTTPPTAAIKAELIPKTSDQCYNFDGRDSEDPDGEIVSYKWDLGDQNSQEGDVIEYCYTTGGRYVVTLTVTDNDGLTGSATTEVNVPELDP